MSFNNIPLLIIPRQNIAPRRNYRSFNPPKSNSSSNYVVSLNYSGSDNKSNRRRSTPQTILPVPLDNCRQRIPSTSSTGSGSSSASGSTVKSSLRHPTGKHRYFSYNSKFGRDEKPSQAKFCSFCKKNREPRELFSSHTVKDKAGRTTCPILFKYVCELCGATGSESHTRSYCPMANAVKDIFDDGEDFLQYRNFASQKAR